MRNFRTIFCLWAFVFSSVIPSLAQAAADPLAKSSILPSKRYDSCTSESRLNPDASLEKALRWYDEDQSLGAQHCIALSLYGMRHFKEAAETLEKTAASIAYAYPELKANVLLQASKAWSMNNAPDQSLAAIGKAISVAAENQHNTLLAHLLIERSGMIQKQGKDLFQAVQDLDHVLALIPEHTDALLARARLLDKLGQRDAAKSDYQELVRLNPNHVEAMRYLTRGPSQQKTIPTAAVSRAKDSKEN